MQKAKLQIKNQNEEIKNFVKNDCPNLWSILNRKAQANLPEGFQEYLSGENTEIKTGKSHLRNFEARLEVLFKKLTGKCVGNYYRRDLSGVDNENQLAELLCEITLAGALSELSPIPPMIRPKNNGGRSCDVKVCLNGNDVYGESKRSEDPGPCGERSIAKSSPGQKPINAHRPRPMDIHSKLKDVYKQFPTDTLNVVFIFHPGYCESRLYICQALFGDKGCTANGNEIALESDGLFSIKEWNSISGCAYTQVNMDGTLLIIKLWQNPNAKTLIPVDVIKELEKLK
jgi:hypothetical protein